MNYMPNAPFSISHAHLQLNSKNTPCNLDCELLLEPLEGQIAGLQVLDLQELLIRATQAMSNNGLGCD